MAAQQILLDEPACALSVGAEIDGNAIVDNDRERSPNDRAWMRAGTIRSTQEIIESGFHHHAGAVVFGKLQQLFAEASPVANDRVNKVFGGLALDCDLALQTGEGIIPRR